MDPLIIKVDEIDEPRQLEKRPLSLAFLREVFSDAPEYSPDAASELKAHVTKVGERDVLLEGAASIALKSECRRCLTDVHSEIPVVFTLNLVARKPEPIHGRKHEKHEPASEEEEQEIDESGLDEETFDGETIELSPLLREQILLSLPSIEPLCQDACKGLCVVCGQDLNVADCGHAQKAPDPRWTALKDLKV